MGTIHYLGRVGGERPLSAFFLSEERTSSGTQLAGGSGEAREQEEIISGTRCSQRHSERAGQTRGGPTY